MIIRAIEKNDEDKIEAIRNKFYDHEFGPIDFRDNFICAFVVEEEGRIITAGGVRTIAEAIAVTNKDFTPYKRRQALMKMLLADAHIARMSGYDSLHAFIQDQYWAEHLVKKGFRHTKGDALVLGLNNG